MKYYKKSLDEKESIVNINYFDVIVEVYNTRNAILKKLNKYLG